MQRKKSLIFGLICGIACMMGVFLYLQEAQALMEKEHQDALARYGGEQVEVYVATRDVLVGEVVDASNTEKRLWLAALLPQGAVSDLDVVAGKTAMAPLYKGEVLLEARFNSVQRQTLQVPEGLCAVSVPSKSVTAVGGSLAPGTIVDVYATSGLGTDLVASRVEVLSTSALAADGKESGSPDVTWVTLAVKPGLVEELIAASQKAELYFALPSEGAPVAGTAKPDAEKPDATAGGKDGGEGAASSQEGASALAGGASGEEDASGAEGGRDDARVANTQGNEPEKSGKGEEA